MHPLNRPRPRRLAVTIGAVTIAATILGAFAVNALLPHASAWTTRLVVLVGLAAVVTAVLAATRGWAGAGFRTRVVEPRLLVVPAVIALIPLLAGVHLPGASMLTVFVVGYAVTGFFEEALFRGLVLGVLRPTGSAGEVWPAVWISSALFATAHLPNMLFGQAPAITVAQAVGAFCFGVGYGAVRVRTATVLPLMVLHFLTDLFLRIDALPIWAHWTVMVGGDTLLLLYGLLLLRPASHPVVREHRSIHHLSKGPAAPPRIP